MFPKEVLLFSLTARLPQCSERSRTRYVWEPREARASANQVTTDAIAAYLPLQSKEQRPNVYSQQIPDTAWTAGG